MTDDSSILTDFCETQDVFEVGEGTLATVEGKGNMKCSVIGDGVSQSIKVTDVAMFYLSQITNCL